ncbi:hypothetical protein HKCCE2091_10125 [Rhodobacterales bacterium HKCCE2091]|nr:hypothetical protein [Rhodobacterales bacterium HKCCE2091]
MQIFRCPACAGPVFFENLACSCGQAVHFDPEAQTMVAEGDDCGNRSSIGCNWLAETDGLCRSCAMTETVPDIETGDNLELWSRTEAAKRWCLAGLGRWGWFTASDPGARPVFRMLSEVVAGGEDNVVMGHADGVVTINVTEAEDAVRAERRADLGELYRTMIGHMRHEIAHFLHLRLSENENFLAAFRDLFGDEREDYAAALERHYADPAPGGGTHITSYASAHPHEDWAETTAHILHLVDLLDSAAAAGIGLPDLPLQGYDAYAETDPEPVIQQAVDVAIAINHVNRAVDLPDLYPFVLSDAVRAKLGFVHGALRGQPAP